jgi:thiosulfate/3-mercaptopyruvate sulfurtransferase
LRLVGVVTGASPAPSFIPGSVAVHVGDVLTASFAPVEPIAFAASMMMHGIGDADWIVAYDAVPSTTPASEAFVRALRHYGHPRAFVLEGGLAAHRRAGLPTTRLPIAVAPSSFTARAPKSSA